MNFLSKWTLLILFFCAFSHVKQTVYANGIVNADPKFNHLREVQGTALGTVNTVLQSSDGFIWLGTDNGLIRYDGHALKSFSINSLNNKLSSNIVVALAEDRAETLWVGTYGGGLNSIDLNTSKVTHFRSITDDETSLRSDYIRFLFTSGKDELWVNSPNGIDRFNTSTLKNHRVSHSTEIPIKTYQSGVWASYKDTKGKYWITALGEGVHIYDPKAKLTSQLKRTDEHKGLVNNFVRSVVEDNQGRIWLGTDGGISLYDPIKKTFKNYVHDPNNSASLSGNEVNVLFKDLAGNIWVGTYGSGLNLYDESTDSFIRFNKAPHIMGQFSANIINAIFQDKEGTLWFATEDGVFTLTQQALAIHQSVSKEQQNITVISVYQDSHNAIWIGTSNGVFRRKHNQENWENRVPQIKDASTITEDKYGNIWIGSLSQGLASISRDADSDPIFYTKSPEDGGLLSTSVRSLKSDSNGNVWVGLAKLKKDSGGFALLDRKTNTFEHFFTQMNVMSIVDVDADFLLVGTNDRGVALFDKNTQTILRFPALKDSKAQNIKVLFKDNDGRIWVGTDGYGLWEYIHSSRDLIHHPHIKASIIKGISQDQHGTLWLSGSDSVLKLSSDITVSRQFGTSAGFHSTVFNDGASIISRDNTLYLGTSIGLTHVQLADLVQHEEGTTPVLTHFKIFNKEVTVSDSEDAILRKEIDRTASLSLSYKDYLFSFTFTSLNLIHQSATRYQYKMEGLDKDWIETDANNRVATYTTLPAGKYTFKVKSSHPDGSWNNSEKSLDINITPPIWKTWQAYILYLIAAISLISFFIQYRISLLKIRAEKLEIGVKERTIELRKSRDELAQKTETISSLLLQKQRMFANISHEFMTPLTLILSPIEDLLSATHDRKKETKLTLVKRNAQRLLRMVEQLLQLAKLESKQPLIWQTVSLKETIYPITQSFRAISEKKAIRLQVSDVEEINITLVEDSLERIISNLLSNAIKYTPNGGRVKLTLNTNANTQTLFICVSDNGVGIEQNKQSVIFERFSRANHYHDEKVPGAGVGLALVKELVDANQGTLRLESHIGKGSRFEVCLPLTPKNTNESIKTQTVTNTPLPPNSPFVSEALLALEASSITHAHNHSLVAVDEIDDNKQSLLLIEDNADMRAFLSESFQPQYNCLEAENGELGLKRALDSIPDLIICDVMMPGIDGFEVVRRIREDERTSHIPILMLTAKGDLESRMQGWEENVDEYIAKPFHKDELILRVSNLLSIRNLLSKRLGAQISASHAYNKVLSNEHKRERKFIEKFEKVISENYTSQGFDRSQAAQLMHIGERQLNRKLAALVDHNFSEYLRKYRLRKATELLHQKLTVAQIADEVGFSSTTYFSSCFKAEFGMTVKEYEQKHSQP